MLCKGIKINLNTKPKPKKPKSIFDKKDNVELEPQT